MPDREYQKRVLDGECHIESARQRFQTAITFNSLQVDAGVPELSIFLHECPWVLQGEQVEASDVASGIVGELVPTALTSHWSINNLTVGITLHF